jgi:hypothetical protein
MGRRKEGFKGKTEGSKEGRKFKVAKRRKVNQDRKEERKYGLKEGGSVGWQVGQVGWS